MSSFLNTLSGTIYEDFIKDHMAVNTSQKRASDIMKIIVAILGIVAMCLVFIVQHLGGILELTYIIRGAVTGPVLAMFTLGMLMPVINETGIFYGSIGGFLIMCWIAIGAKYYTIIGQIGTKKLPLSTDGCLNISNITLTNNITNIHVDNQQMSEPFYLYRISIYYYCLLGIIATAMIALPVSWFTRKEKEILDNNLYSPVIHKFVNKYNDQIRKERLKSDYELEYLNKIAN